MSEEQKQEQLQSEPPKVPNHKSSLPKIFFMIGVCLVVLIVIISAIAGHNTKSSVIEDLGGGESIDGFSEKVQSESNAGLESSEFQDGHCWLSMETSDANALNDQLSKLLKEYEARTLYDSLRKNDLGQVQEYLLQVEVPREKFQEFSEKVQAMDKTAVMDKQLEYSYVDTAVVSDLQTELADYQQRLDEAKQKLESATGEERQELEQTIADLEAGVKSYQSALKDETEEENWIPVSMSFTSVESYVLQLHQSGNPSVWSQMQFELMSGLQQIGAIGLWLIRCWYLILIGVVFGIWMARKSKQSKK